MSLNARFIRYSANKARRVSGLFPRITNGSGTYPGSPALVQDPAFPMDNVLLNGRTGTVYVWPASTGPNSGNDVLIEIDLGSLQTIVAGGVLGAIAANGSFPSSVRLECLPGISSYQTTGWVDANFAAPITNVATTRDGGKIITPISAKFWRFRFVNASLGSGFSVASVVLATVVTDLGFLYSGADETRIIPRTLVESYSRVPTITRVGGEYRRWAIRHDNTDAATRAIFDGIYGDVQPVVFLTPDDNWQECVWDTEDFMRSHVWAPPDRYGMVVGLRSLP